MIELVECEHSELSSFRSEARRCGMITYRRQRGRYWLIVAGQCAVGFCGILRIGRTKYRLISCLVMPEYRGLGYGDYATRRRIEIVRAIPEAMAVEVETLNPDYFRALGFAAVREQKPFTWMLLPCR